MGSQLRGTTGCLRVLVVDTEALPRDGLVLALGQVEGIKAIGCSFDPGEARQSARAFDPDVVVVSVAPGWDDVVKSVRAEAGRAHVIGLASALDLPLLHRLLEAGVEVVLRGPVGVTGIVSAVRAVVGGYSIVPSDLLRGLVQRVALPGRRRAVEGSERLTVRQICILGGAVQGLTDAELARSLNISLSVVKAEIRTILSKMGVRNRREMVAVALRTGLLS